ncbi:hypothetical protein RJ639_027525 [Escallonia herrerae]|uniref:peroxidase n=1 Tax=Escallonia herrerae TaxID=1293975 RepID=A0AA88XB72_9ASTE|nr:hypothetical protein RJ639_027525 [Escallonia herrerae]
MEVGSEVEVVDQFAVAVIALVVVCDVANREGGGRGVSWVLGLGHCGELRKNFYKTTCRHAEQIVQNITWKHAASNLALPAKLLRMHFHDCFVRFNRSMWEVLTGRRDGNISRASEALTNIPSPFANFTTLKQSFASKNLTVQDLVVLSGAHTIGVGHCNLFSNRLYNFTGKGDADPSLNSTYAAFLKTKCQSLSDTTTTVDMDPGSSVTFDNDYFTSLKLQKGLFQSDAALLTNKGSSNIVNEMLRSGKFFTEFSQSMKRMGAIGVLTGSSGEIRRKCNRIKMRLSFVVLILSLVVLRTVRVCNGGQLKMMYYRRSCPSVPFIARNITWSNVAANPSLAAKLLRLHYHDCFVRGCDASILLDSTQNSTAEKAALPNRSLSGYDVIDEIKTKLEEECPGVVSCADIVALAARDAVSFQFQRPMWQVLMGRKDGKFSLASEVTGNLPSSSANFTTLLGQFANKGLDIVDLVTLSGAHTIVVTHCALFARRLYNFTGHGDADPSLNPDYAATLRTICPLPLNTNTTVDMDPDQSSLSFDSHYFKALNQKKGLFLSDAALLTDSNSAQIAQVLQNGPIFLARFAYSVKKMGGVGVLSEGDGEVRQNCRVVNV